MQTQSIHQIQSNMPDNKHDSYPVVFFKTRGSFEKWLVKNHRLSDGVWLKIAKISAGIKSVSYQEALDIALCYGWIDGLRRGLDYEFFVQKFTPRRANSIWSVINKKKVDSLIAQGRMKESGFEAIEKAKKTDVGIMRIIHKKRLLYLLNFRNCLIKT